MPELLRLFMGRSLFYAPKFFEKVLHLSAFALHLKNDFLALIYLKTADFRLNYNFLCRYCIYKSDFKELLCAI